MLKIRSHISIADRSMVWKKKLSATDVISPARASSCASSVRQISR
jgi:hypothetical protein